MRTEETGRAAGSQEVRHMVKRLALIGGLAVMLVVGLAIAQTPFGGDDGGFVTSNKGFAKCENAVGKAAAKAIACIIKCHKGRQSGKFADDTAEDNCESGPDPKSCKSKYDNAVATPKGCPCDPNFFAFIESNVDTVNGSVYCSQSPSGAFLD